jgi:hypothetical protein
VDWSQFTNPFKLQKLLWPDITFYRKQREIINSVFYEADRTTVPASHMAGKDFIAAFIVIAFFLTRHPCRIVTTSVDTAQLNGVLWGEMRRFIQSSKYPLNSEQGGPLLINDMKLRKVYNNQVCGLSYVVAKVAQKGESISGHHIAKTGDGINRTLFVGDEASAIDHNTLEKATEWANTMLLIGNPYKCANMFYWDVKGRRETDDPGGDLRKTYGTGYYRKVIRICADDSPNVQYAKAEIAAGREPSGKILVPGVLPYEDYVKRRKTWDKMKQSAGLDGLFYEGAEVSMFPPDWLSASSQYADKLRGQRRRGISMGIDPAEGGDNTAICISDAHGVVELISLKTPDTQEIIRRIKAGILKHKIQAQNIVLDRGGGGKQLADQLKADGYPVRTIGFGEAPTKEDDEQKSPYFNKRAELYGLLREAMDPYTTVPKFSIPALECKAIHDQLSPIPLTYDSEGRMVLLPKRRNLGSNRTGKTLVDIIGHSPDEADACVLSLYAIRKPIQQQYLGAL